MGINRDKLIAIQKRLYEIDKSVKAALHTLTDILGDANAAPPPTEPLNKISSTGVKFPLQTKALTLGDMVTAKQLGMIRAIGRELGINVEFECLGLLKHSTDELNKLAASSFIEHLENLQKAKTT